MWRAKLEETTKCRQQMYEYLLGALQLFPTGAGRKPFLYVFVIGSCFFRKPCRPATAGVDDSNIYRLRLMSNLAPKAPFPGVVQLPTGRQHSWAGDAKGSLEGGLSAGISAELQPLSAAWRRKAWGGKSNKKSGGIKVVVKAS